MALDLPTIWAFILAYIWTRYIENEERPLETIVKDAAAKAQECSDDAYANE